jgi:hypothetical protein
MKTGQSKLDLAPSMRVGNQSVVELDLVNPIAGDWRFRDDLEKLPLDTGRRRGVLFTRLPAHRFAASLGERFRLAGSTKRSQIWPEPAAIWLMSVDITVIDVAFARPTEFGRELWKRESCQTSFSPLRRSRIKYRERYFSRSTSMPRTRSRFPIKNLRAERIFTRCRLTRRTSETATIN